MIAVSDVLARVGLILNDVDFVRWTKSELFGWINDAAGEIVIRRPPAGARTTEVTLIAGVSQTLPAGAHLLMDVVRNLPVGRRITVAERHRLEESVPGWYEMKSSGTLRHYCYEDRNPQQFYVYPPATAGAKVEAVIAFVPPKIADETAMLELGAEYIGPLVSYVVYRALLKDSEYANGQVAVAHFQAFSEALGTNTQVSLDASPTRAKP
jgi:hypothetical protein